MPLKVDLHSHSFFSSDGVSSPEELIAAARGRGLDALAITDHNNDDSIDYLLERGLMREDGLPVDGFLLVPGVEVTTAEGHLLCLGTGLSGEVRGLEAAEVCHRIHEAGGMAVPAHPYDCFRAGIRESVLEGLEVDALEVFNAATTLDRHNRKAMAYAEGRWLGMLCSSDAHHASAVGVAYTVLDTEELSLSSLLSQIPNGRPGVRGYQGFRSSMRKTLGGLRWGRARRATWRSCAT